jgi:hypothetical protein
MRPVFLSPPWVNPKLAGSLYGRGIAELRNGETAAGSADIAAATAIQANITSHMADLGVRM